MTGARSMFKELDESFKKLIRLGDVKQIEVEGKGTVAVKNSHGKVKLLHDVLFSPSLAHNLLSVGQLICSGYSIWFDNGSCEIKDKKSGQILAKVCMAENNLFPLEIASVENHALVASEKNETSLWHLRYGNLNINGLKLLSQNEMVLGLPNIESIDMADRTSEYTEYNICCLHALSVLPHIEQPVADHYHVCGEIKGTLVEDLGVGLVTERKHSSGNDTLELRTYRATISKD
ncbi:hypothetical protein RJ639_013341 [Escallonia herrerae]|uniref:Uncharacterized protein n=1 Tax=Escallonia herrerae TaxID=1293975 RepID=A0AA89AKN9_9ASTE|nr:hypothetical protein RJ639_013341 [Escallonia herrerae]